MTKTCDTVMEDGRPVCTTKRAEGSVWCPKHYAQFKKSESRHAKNKTASKARRQNRSKK